MYKTEAHILLLRALQKTLFVRCGDDEDDFRNALTNALYDICPNWDVRVPSTRAGGGDIGIRDLAVEIKYATERKAIQLGNRSYGRDQEKQGQETDHKESDQKTDQKRQDKKPKYVVDDFNRVLRGEAHFFVLAIRLQHSEYGSYLHTYVKCPDLPRSLSEHKARNFSVVKVSDEDKKEYAYRSLGLFLPVVDFVCPREISQPIWLDEANVNLKKLLEEIRDVLQYKYRLKKSTCEDVERLLRWVLTGAERSKVQDVPYFHALVEACESVVNSETKEKILESFEENCSKQKKEKNKGNKLSYYAEFRSAVRLVRSSFLSISATDENAPDVPKSDEKTGPLIHVDVVGSVEDGMLILLYKRAKDVIFRPQEQLGDKVSPSEESQEQLGKIVIPSEKTVVTIAERKLGSAYVRTTQGPHWTQKSEAEFPMEKDVLCYYIGVSSNACVDGKKSS